MKCKHCGNQIAKGSKKCDRCGNKVGRTNNRLFLIILFLLLLAGGCVGVYYGLKNVKRHTPTKVIITVKPNVDAMGTVKGGGEYERNETVTIEAIANEGCHFVEWNDGNSDRLRKVVADQDQVYLARFDSIVTITPIEGPDSIEEDSDANDDSEVSEIPVVPVTPVIPKFTITVKTDDPNMGTVKGGGDWDSLAVIKIEAQPKNGYQFVSWKDGDKNRIRTVKVTSSQTFVATFREKPSTPREEDVIQPSQEGTIQINWNGVATYNGPGQGGTPHGVGGKLVFNSNYQLDLKDINGTKLEISAGETIKDTKFVNGKLRQGTLHRKDGSTKWFSI